jgi:CotS family spore coat protein
LNIDELRKLLEESYSLKVLELEKVKNVYRVKTPEEDYCLKMIKYKFSHFWFILSAIKHLQNNGFDRVPDIFQRKDGADFISIDNQNAYLTKWIAARESNYDNPIDVSHAAIKLAELHNKSEGFCVTGSMQPRVYWYKWVQHFRTRTDEILDFKRRIELKEKNSEFDYLYLSKMEQELKRAEKAVDRLIKSQYVDKVNEEIVKSGFCHHDYAHHNVLVEESGRINIIDFDYCILDIHLHDLGSLLIRTMKNGKWDLDTAVSILDSYSSIRKVERRDIPIMAAFMEFPQDYWQVGIQYYWEEQPWGEDFFIKKLKKIYEDLEEKQDFVDEFKAFKYGIQ